MARRARTHRASLRTALLGAGLALAAGAQPPAASFTARQAALGRIAYEDSCGSCHRTTLAGVVGEFPELAGAEFRGMWGGRPARELVAYIRVAMPPAGHKPDEETLTAIAAYILERNGMRAGDTPLTAETDGVITRTPR